MSALIELRDITKTYGQGQVSFQALKGVSLSIEKGDFVAVMGPSGSGKSTIMNILGCLDMPTSGEYQFRDVHVEALSRNERALLRRHYLGFVPAFTGSFWSIFVTCRSALRFAPEGVTVTCALAGVGSFSASFVTAT